MPLPPPVCTGSGWPVIRWKIVAGQAITEGTCGICGQIVLLDYELRAATHAYLLAPTKTDGTPVPPRAA